MNQHLKTRPIVIAATLLAVALTLPTRAADWTRYGGPNADHTVADADLKPWGKSGPKTLWSRDLGDGHSEVLHRKGRLYTMYRDADAGEEVIVSLNALTGETIWEHRYPVAMKEGQTDQFGFGPNTTPLILGDRIFTAGFVGDVRALDVDSGKVLWQANLADDHGAPHLYFGYASSPIEWDGNVLFLTGGKESALVLSAKDGSVQWRGPEVPISYSTPRIFDVEGDPQLMFMAPTEVVGISMNSGDVAWRFPHQNQWDTNCLGPWYEDGLMFVSSSGDAGSRSYKLSDGKFEEVADNLKVKLSFASVVREGGIMYASAGKAMVAHDIATGENLWQKRFAPDTSVVMAGDRSLLLSNEGTLYLTELSTKKLKVLAEAELLEKPARTAPTINGSIVYLRDQKKLMALDLSAGKTSKKGP